MTTFNLLLAVHLLGIVWWIGGVAMVTGILLPAFERLSDDAHGRRIRVVEHRFARQARIAVLVVGASGVWMLVLSGGLARLASARSWWLDLMILVWVLFTALLFVAEPLGPRRIGLPLNRFGFFSLHAITGPNYPIMLVSTLYFTSSCLI